MLKSSYALGEARATENVTIDNCMVSGYDLGTMYDGTFKTEEPYGRVGRIKFGTESNGGFKNVAISNVIFEHCRGLALQTVDGGLLEDVTISNLTMRQVQMPIFLWREQAHTIPLDTTHEPLTPAVWLATASELGGKQPGRCVLTMLFRREHPAYPSTQDRR